MERPTYKSIQEAAKKSKRAAIKSSKEKYLYLLSLTSGQLKRIPEEFLRESGCAICIRHTNSLTNKLRNKCPFKLNCYGNCIKEWVKMYKAWDVHCTVTYTDEYYYKFITYAAKIYLKLLEL